MGPWDSFLNAIDKAKDTAQSRGMKWGGVRGLPQDLNEMNDEPHGIAANPGWWGQGFAYGQTPDMLPNSLRALMSQSQLAGWQRQYTPQQRDGR